MDSANFTEDLSEKIRNYGQEMERTVLPTLKNDFLNFSTIFANFLAILKKKGLLAEDPYQYEEKISDITPIGNEPFLEGQKSTVMSIRLHNFDNQLNYLKDYFQFSLDFLHLARLKNISLFTRFVRWDMFSESSQEINTRVLAEIAAKVRKGDDPISISLINDNINQLSSYQVKILEAIKKITLFKREEYKLMIRSTFWDGLNLAREEVDGNPENVQRKIKKEFAGHIKGHPYVPELIKELLDEDFSAGGETLRRALLSKMTVTQSVKEKQKTVVDFRANLMEAVRTIASVNLPLEVALKKIQENSLVLLDNSVTLGERFQRWIRGLMGIKKQPTIFEIEIFDPITSTTKQEDIDFGKFFDESYGRVRVLTNLANRASPQFVALSQKTEEEVLDTLERIYIETSRTVERLNGLDLFFKTETPKEKRIQIKGVKTEVAQIRTILARANKLKHEYVAAREEQEQLKRLGIKVD